MQPGSVKCSVEVLLFGDSGKGKRGGRGVKCRVVGWEWMVLGVGASTLRYLKFGRIMWIISIES